MRINSTHFHEAEQTMFIKDYQVSDIINRYERELQINVSQFFAGVGGIKLLECKNTGYQFYVPKHIEGNGLFYEQLQKFAWYYMAWKWEHGSTLKFVTTNDKILEVGSGGLGFVQELDKMGYDITGLELNDKSVQKASQLNLKVYPNTIQQFSKLHTSTFDVVCSFQVLEHIADVQNFLQAKIDCLKVGGKLIICVPNNDSFIKYNEGGILNFPPHHMGRWQARSLKSLSNVFNLKLIRLEYEPLQNYHVDWYVSATTARLKKMKFFRGVHKIIKVEKIVRWYLKVNQRNVKGHSILAVYKKTK